MSSQSSLVPFNQVEKYESFEDFIEKFPGMLNDIVAAINDRDFGLYDTIETITNQERFNRTDSQKTNSVIRKVIDVGALTDTSTKAVPHGIAIGATTEFIRIYGVANYPSNSFIPLPYIGTSPIYLDVDATNVNITTTDDKTNYTSCTVTLEYIN